MGKDQLPPGEGRGEGNSSRFMDGEQFKKELDASHEPDKRRTIEPPTSNERGDCRRWELDVGSSAFGEER
jgi:hypothetical protein